MAEMLSTLSIIAFIAAGIFLLIAIVLWFYFKIPTVIGDLSGRTARRSIAQMRVANEKSGTKSYKNSKTNAERGKLTETIPDMKPSAPQKKAAPPTPPAAPRQSPPRQDGTTLLDENRAQGMAAEETGLLSGEETGLLVDGQVQAVETKKIQKMPSAVSLTMLDSVMLIHTDEVI